MGCKDEFGVSLNGPWSKGRALLSNACIRPAERGGAPGGGGGGGGGLARGLGGGGALPPIPQAKRCNTPQAKQCNHLPQARSVEPLIPVAI
jgi:hypothetical protein